MKHLSRYKHDSEKQSKIKKYITLVLTSAFLWTIQSVPGVNVTTLGFNSRADSESKTSYTHGSNS